MKQIYFIRKFQGIIYLMKKTAVVISIGVLAAMLCTACGSKKDTDNTLTGDLNSLMDSLYQNAELSDDFREALAYFETYELTDEIEAGILGTDEITYTEGIVSMPMKSSVAYQCVLLRVAKEDVETVKQQLKTSANPDKWVCVSAETVLIESRGDVIFFIMAENDTAYALNAAFQNL